MKSLKTSPKAEAIEALLRAREALSGEVSAVQWSMVNGLVDYALRQVGLVEEVKRRRRREVMR